MVSPERHFRLYGFEVRVRETLLLHKEITVHGGLLGGALCKCSEDSLLCSQTLETVWAMLNMMSHVIGCMETKEDIVNEHHHCANSKSFKSLSTQRSH
ncbi:hypothetical protein NC651_009116 [Populus alba x Populus x berolinensis]|nr:hypothetical protein NC651_009116 [Populus alba x Populus x berolinensis]